MVDPPERRSIGKADLVSANGQFSWPPAGRFVAVYGQDLMAADTSGPRRGPHLQAGRGVMGPDYVDVFVLGTDGRLYHRSSG